MPAIIADCLRFAAFCCSLISESRYFKHLVLIPLPLARARHAGASSRKARATCAGIRNLRRRATDLVARPLSGPGGTNLPDHSATRQPGEGRPPRDKETLMTVTVLY